MKDNDLINKKKNTWEQNKYIVDTHKELEMLIL